MSLTDFTGNALPAPQKRRQMEHLTQVGTADAGLTPMFESWLSHSEVAPGLAKKLFRLREVTPHLASWPGHSGTSLTAVRAQSWPTLCDPMHCSPPGSSVRGKKTGVGCHALLQGIFPTQRSNLHLLHWQADSLPPHHLGSPVKQQPGGPCPPLAETVSPHIIETPQVLKTEPYPALEPPVSLLWGPGALPPDRPPGPGHEASSGARGARGPRLARLSLCFSSCASLLLGRFALPLPGRPLSDHTPARPFVLISSGGSWGGSGAPGVSGCLEPRGTSSFLPAP